MQDINQLYCYGELLGKGAFGSVYKAVCVKTLGEVAIKNISKKSVHADKGRCKHMQQELEQLQRLSHPNIVQVM